MTLQMPDTVVDRVGRVKHSLEAAHQPDAARVAVDGPCPTPGCDARVLTEVRADSSTVECAACGHAFAV